MGDNFWINGDSPSLHFGFTILKKYNQCISYYGLTKMWMVVALQIKKVYHFTNTPYV